jgi:hypothetical protein
MCHATLLQYAPDHNGPITDPDPALIYDNECNLCFRVSSVYEL